MACPHSRRDWQRPVVIKPLNLGESPFKVGDIIVTSGNGGLYPPNIPFARVIARTNDGALARPLPILPTRLMQSS
jgi:hypothetical protein